MQFVARLMAIGASLIFMTMLIGPPAFCQEDPFKLSNYRLLKHPGGCQQEGPGCVPVIFIHGIHGSTQEGKEQVGKGCDLDAPAISDCNWSPLLNHLLARFNPPASTLIPKIQPYIFRYLSDKDDTTLDIGRKLLRLVDCEGPLLAYPSGIQSVPCKAISEPVVIVAHSMGGIVARTFMLQHTSVAPSEPGYKRVLAAITLATPHHGTPLANREWRDWKAESKLPGSSGLLVTLDSLFWGIEGKSPHLILDSSRPNRSDLVWDNYDAFYDKAMAANPNRTWESNPILSSLAASEQARKLVVYGGDLSPSARTWSDLEIEEIAVGLRAGVSHGFLGYSASQLLERVDFNTFLSDGLVPVDSALLLGNRHVGLLRPPFRNFDHVDMRKNIPADDARRKYNNVDLYASVAKDLESVLTWRGVPPRLTALTISPDPAVAGSLLRVKFTVKTAFEPRSLRRVWLKATLGETPLGCVVVDVHAGENRLISLDGDFQLPTGVRPSPTTLAAEILPDNASCNRVTPLDLVPSHDATRITKAVIVQPAPSYSSSLLLSTVMPGGQFSANGFRHGDQITGYYSGSPGSYALADILPRGATPLVGQHCTVDLRHAGVDIAAPIGAAVYPIADGTVDKVVTDFVSALECSAAKSPKPLFCSLGYAVLVKQSRASPGKSNTYSLYLHMQSKPEVAIGAPVTGGKTQIGRVGRTGAAYGTGDHLHLEVRHFGDWFHPRWTNIFGVERAACDRSLTFDSTEFANSWSDPFAFFAPSTPSSLTRPTISLATTNPAKKEYRIGETVQLNLSTTGVGPSSPAPLVSTFLWRDGPDGRKFLVLDNRGLLSATAKVTPVSTPAPAIDFSTVLPPISILPSTQAGSYRWQAELHTGEVFDERNRIAASAAVEYRVVAERIQTPSVISIGTRQSLYRDADTMVINYTTTKGTSAASFDLMLRLTSKASGKEYYFYDNPSDSNRWIHSAVRPMLTSVVTDGTFQIPSGTAPPILIERNVPSGDYTMLAYFSEVGKNLPIGGMAQSSFRLETPTAEGGCFVATAAFGSPMFRAVESLRQFRDRFLMTGNPGRSLVAMYYRVGPHLASTIAPRSWLRKIIRVALWPAVVFSAAALRCGLWFAIVLSLLITVASVLLWRRAVPVARFLILAGLLAITSFAAELHGTVVRSKPFPAPIAGAKIEIENTSRVATSDQYGRFSFDRLTAGTYSVRATAAGYIPGRSTVSVPTAEATVATVIAATPVGTRTYEYYLPHTAEADGWWTFFALLNPNQTAADLSMAAHDAKGTFLGTSSKISLLKIGQQLTGAPSQYFTPDIVAKAAYYKITASAPVSGFEMFGHSSGTLAAFPLTTATSEVAYLPHIAEDSQWWTGVSFISGSIRTDDFHLEAMDRTGKLLVEATGTASLRPGEKTVDQLPNYFGWDFPLDISWARVRSGGPITGFELFGTRDFKMLAAVPALSQGLRNFWFPHIATTDGWWTGIAMLNVDSRSGAARITAFAADGRVLGASRTIPLASLERTVGVPQNYFDSWPAGVAYLEVTSDVDLIAFELTGRFTPNLFGGLPAMPPLGTALAFPYTVSNTTWDTSLGIVNTSTSATTVVIEAMNADGVERSEARFQLAAKGSRFATLRSIFGTVPSGTSWVRARADGGATLSGFQKLSRVTTGEFTDLPAVPVVPATLAGQQSSAGVVGSSPSAERSISAALATLAPQVSLEPVPGGGVRVNWPIRLDDQIQALTSGMLRQGDIVLRVESMPIASRTDLWNAYLQFRSASSVSVLVRRRNGATDTLGLRNPWKATSE